MRDISIKTQYDECVLAWGRYSLPPFERISYGWVFTVSCVASVTHPDQNTTQYSISYSYPWFSALYLLANEQAYDKLWRDITIHELAHIAHSRMFPNSKRHHTKQFNSLLRMLDVPGGRFVKISKVGGEYCFEDTSVLADRVYDLAREIAKALKN